MYQVWRKKAILLRGKGYSYNLIRNKIPVSKSTLTLWLKDTPYEPNSLVKKRVTRNLLRFVMQTRQRRIDSVKKIKEEMKKRISDVSERDLFLFGLGIYMGEGTKSTAIMRIVNADPRVILLSILWLSRIFKVPKSHFVIRIHLYPDSDIKKSLSFWSRATGLPFSQFYKCMIDLRANKSGKKHSKLPYGTAHLGVKSFGKAEFGVQLQRRILSSLDAVFESFGIMQQA